MEPPKLLVSIFMDEKEISKKVFRLRSLQEVVDACSLSTGTLSADCYRVMKFNTDFNEFIDTDVTDIVEDMDKLHVYFRSRDTSVSAEQLNTSEVTTENVVTVIQNEAGPSSQQGPSDIEYLTALLQRKGRSVLADYEATGMLSLTSRKLLVKIGVSDLIERKGFYPPSVDKSRLARCMVNLFPSLKIRMEDENEGFEHFYDPISHNGFIEIRLRNIRRSLQDDQRRYQRKRGRTADKSGGSMIVEMPEEGEEAAAEWKTMIKRMRPSQENITIIKEGMEKTYAYRRLWITSSSPTVQDIFAEYPRFVDMPNLLDAEFGRMFPGKADNFIRKWEATIVPKLLKIPTEKEPTSVPPVPENDASCFKALQALIQLLPPTSAGKGKGGKCSVKSALGHLLDMKPIGTSIASLLNDHPPEHLLESRQPHLVCIGQAHATAQYIIIAENDKVAIPLQDNGLTYAMDKLFKMFWICNTVYPCQLKSVFHFFETVYEVPLSSGKRAKVMELLSKLQAIH